LRTAGEGEAAEVLIPKGKSSDSKSILPSHGKGTSGLKIYSSMRGGRGKACAGKKGGNPASALKGGNEDVFFPVPRWKYSLFPFGELRKRLPT